MFDGLRKGIQSRELDKNLGRNFQYYTLYGFNRGEKPLEEGHLSLMTEKFVTYFKANDYGYEGLVNHI